jgi:F-type H+-transporting ATPase subunit b
MELNATFLLQLSMFLFLLAWLSNFLFGPLMKVFDEREKRIEGAAEEAKSFRASAEAAAGTIEEKLAAAQADARAVLGELREKGQDLERKHIDEARSAAQSRLEDARADLFAATEDARAELKSDVEKIADQIVEKVLGRAA